MNPLAFKLTINKQDIPIRMIKNRDDFHVPDEKYATGWRTTHGALLVFIKVDYMVHVLHLMRVRRSHRVRLKLLRPEYIVTTTNFDVLARKGKRHVHILQVFMSHFRLQSSFFFISSRFRKE